MRNRYSSWSIEINIDELKNGYVVTTESIKGISRNIANTEKEIAGIIAADCEKAALNKAMTHRILKELDIDILKEE